MKASRRIITADEMDKMTPQERADAIDAGIIRSWDEVDPAFREQILTRAPEIASRLAPDA